MDGLRCIDDFTTSCLDADHRAYFNTLYTGTTQVIMDLCQTGQYQTEYLKHARCMRDAQTEYESCVDVYQLRIKALNKGEIATPDEEDDNVQVLCCSFQRYLHCRLHQEVPGPDVWSPGAATLPALRVRLLHVS